MRICARTRARPRPHLTGSLCCQRINCVCFCNQMLPVFSQLLPLNSQKTPRKWWHHNCTPPLPPSRQRRVARQPDNLGFAWREIINIQIRFRSGWLAISIPGLTWFFFPPSDSGSYRAYICIFIYHFTALELHPSWFAYECVLLKGL